jgi:hypothetical protein
LNVERRLVELARESPELGRRLAEVGGELVRDARAAEAFYRTFHWGRRGARAGRLVEVPRVFPGEPLAELGEMTLVGYGTRKGGERVASEYVHEFKRPYPTLAYSLRERALVICGGGYRVEARGIVG